MEIEIFVSFKMQKIFSIAAIEVFKLDADQSYLIHFSVKHASMDGTFSVFPFSFQLNLYTDLEKPPDPAPTLRAIMLESI